MKKKIFVFSLLSVMLIFVLLLNNCQTENTDEISAITQDNAMAEKVFADVKSMSDQAANNNKSYFIAGMDNNMLGGIKLTFDTITAAKRITIDFDTTNTLCNWDGCYRRGKIIITYTGFYRTPGTVITITFNNYFVNDNQVLNSSSKTITNNGRNTSGHLNWTENVVANIISWDNRNINWTSTIYSEWITGESTFLNWQDDEYMLTGSSSGISGSGKPWTINITKSLHIKLGCRWITDGTLEILPSGISTITVDYGTGACDSQASATYKGKVYHITMH